MIETKREAWTYQEKTLVIDQACKYHQVDAVTAADPSFLRMYGKANTYMLWTECKLGCDEWHLGSGYDIAYRALRDYKPNNHAIRSIFNATALFERTMRNIITVTPGAKGFQVTKFNDCYYILEMFR